MRRKINKQKEAPNAHDFYRATREELRAIDDADSSGVANDKDVEAAFGTFRRPP
jgi:hypothetical protein